MCTSKEIDEHWIQLNVGLVRAKSSALASARSLFHVIQPWIQSWLDQGELKWVFFMRKPPDVRLRFWLAHEKPAIMKLLQHEMSKLQQQGVITQFFFSDYEPETERFGGVEAMQAVHQYFTLDTLSWFVLDCLEQQNYRQLSPELLLITVIHDLFRQTLKHDVLVLRTWEQLGTLIPLSPNTMIPEIEVVSLSTLRDLLSPEVEEYNLLSEYRQGNLTLSRKLITLRETNQLTTEITDVLATIALFNFHRHGFVSYCAPFIEAMRQLLVQIP